MTFKKAKAKCFYCGSGFIPTRMLKQDNEGVFKTYYRCTICYHENDEACIKEDQLSKINAFGYAEDMK